MATNLPTNHEAELSVIGGMMLDATPDDVAAVLAMLSDDAFHHPMHRNVYRAIHALITRREALDDHTEIAELRSMGELEACGGAAKICAITEDVPTAANLLHHARIVLASKMRRDLIRRATALASDARDMDKQLCDICLEHSRALADMPTSGVHTATALRAAVKAAMDETTQRSRDGKSLGLTTGIAEYDRAIGGGLQRNVLHVIGARPSMGKTALACDIVRHSGEPAVYVSHEMDRTALAHRLLCADAPMDSHIYYTGEIDNPGWSRLSAASNRLADKRVWIIDRGARSVAALQAATMPLKAMHGVQLIIVDYLQLMQSKQRRSDSREREVADISRGLQTLASELGITVIALAQLNRQCEQRENKRPVLADLRESGAIEQDAHTITFLYRDEYYNEHTERPGIAELRVAKNRNGPIGSVEVRWDAKRMAFGAL